MKNVAMLTAPPNKELLEAIQALLDSAPALAHQPTEETRMWVVKWVLRLAFLTLADHRRMLPVHNSIYRQSYSLGHLWECLRQQHQRDPASMSHSTWGFARLRSLCRLVHQGASHPALTLCGYGGEFFLEPAPDRSQEASPSDAALYLLLNVLLDPRMLLKCSQPGSTAEIMGNLYQVLIGLAVVREGAALVAVRQEAVRKAQGTYYTPVTLVRPMVERTLEPLVERDGAPSTPDQILALRLLDPAVGSGTFLVEALRYLADKLVLSVQFHRRASPVDGPLGPWRVVLDGSTSLELPASPESAPGQKRLLLHLKRLVSERCLHGIDMDPVAVEVARLGLWLETLDPALPFTFLDHAIRVGNSLVGAPLSSSWRYPLAAALRAIQEHPIVSERQQRRTRLLHQARAVQRNAVTPPLPGLGGPLNLSRLRRKLTQTLERIHQMVDELPETKKQRYDLAFTQSPEAKALRRRLDGWCALWFWPPERLSELPDPEKWVCGETGPEELVTSLAKQWRFFHWEMEFPSVFGGPNPGFDAILANPPWERVAALGTVGSQNSPLRRFVEDSAAPGGPLQGLYDRLSRDRTPSAIYQWQGDGEYNLYQLFMERCMRWLNANGRLGLLVPSGFSGDAGAARLRQALFKEMSVEWIVGMSNRRKFFEIDGRFGFLALIAARGGPTRTFRSASEQSGLEILSTLDSSALEVAPAALPSNSRSALLLPEFSDRLELTLLTDLMRHPPLQSEGQGGFNVAYRRELDMTAAGGRFQPVWQMEEQGFVADDDGVWRASGGREALPLVQGATFHAFCPWNNRWEGDEKGRWGPNSQPSRPARPKFLVPRPSGHSGRPEGYKLVMRRLARNSDERTLLSCVVPAFPCGDKAPTLLLPDPQQMLALCALLNSLVLDWVCRSVGSGTNVDWHRVRTLPLPRLDTPDLLQVLPPLALALHPAHPLYTPLWRTLSVSYPWLRERPPSEWTPAAPEARRMLQAALDAHVARLYGVSATAFAWIVKQCHHPAETLALPAFTRSLPQRGFWRVDKTLEPAMRRTNLALRWLSDARLMGLSAKEVLLRCREDYFVVGATVVPGAASALGAGAGLAATNSMRHST